MKVLVTGGRRYGKRERVYAFLDELHKLYEFKYLIHGDCNSRDTNRLSADQLAHRWAQSRGVQPVACCACWGYYGNSAGPRRNAKMLGLGPDLVVAFPGTDGTLDMIGRAEFFKIPVIKSPDWE